MNFRGRRPVLVALASQGAAVLVSLALIQGYHAATGGDLPLAVKLAAACVAAGIAARLLGANRAWAGLMTIMPALFVGALLAELPVWLPAAVLAALVLVLRNSLGERVPLYLSNVETLGKLAALVPQDDAVRTIDLGCGFGAVPRALARHNSHPDSRFVGVENAPVPYAMAKLAAWRQSDRRVEIRWGSLWDEALSGYDLVYAFLSPQPMPRLFEKIRSEMKPASRFVSNSFAVPDNPADDTVVIERGRATALYIWRLPISTDAEAWTEHCDSA